MAALLLPHGMLTETGEKFRLYTPILLKIVKDEVTGESHVYLSVELYSEVTNTLGPSQEIHIKTGKEVEMLSISPKVKEFFTSPLVEVLPSMIRFKTPDESYKKKVRFNVTYLSDIAYIHELDRYILDKDSDLLATFKEMDDEFKELKLTRQPESYLESFMYVLRFYNFTETWYWELTRVKSSNDSYMFKDSSAKDRDTKPLNTYSALLQEAIDRLQMLRKNLLDVLDGASVVQLRRLGITTVKKD